MILLFQVNSSWCRICDFACAVALARYVRLRSITRLSIPNSQKKRIYTNMFQPLDVLVNRKYIYMFLPHHLLLFYFYETRFADILFFIKKINLEAGEMNRLDELENRSIYIIREAYSHFEKIAALWSMGKDSTVLLTFGR